MATVMVMGLALLVYSLAQRYVRRALMSQEALFPDPSRRPTPTPTLKRVFQLFEGISILYQDDQPIKVLGLDPLHTFTLHLLGPQYEQMYLVNPG